MKNIFISCLQVTSTLHLSWVIFKTFNDAISTSKVILHHLRSEDNCIL